LADSITSPHDSEALYAAAGEPKELWLLPGVEHCGAYFADRAVYSNRVAAFFRRALAPSETAMPEAQSAR